MEYVIDETTTKHSGKNNTKKFIVLHHTGQVASLKNMTAFLSKNKAQVSAHYVIDLNGDISRIGTDDYILWHAGTGNKIPGFTNSMNSNSIGIEVISDGVSFTKEQIKKLSILVKELRDKYDISNDNIIRHKDYSERKWDIGDNFYKTLGYSSFEEWKSGELRDLLLPEDDTIKYSPNLKTSIDQGFISELDLDKKATKRELGIALGRVYNAIKGIK